MVLLRAAFHDNGCPQTVLLLLCVWEWRKVAVSSSMRSLKSRVDEINGERRRLDKVVAIMRKVRHGFGAHRTLASRASFPPFS
jgi:hypothetical protein